MQAQRYKIPSTNALLARVLLELLALFCFGYPMLHIYVFLQGDAEPYHRGFYCDGEFFPFIIIVAISLSVKCEWAVNNSMNIYC